MSQTDEIHTTVYSILRDPAFQAGVEDARAGRPARFDDPDHLGYEYERGRQFAFVAPMTMRLFRSSQRVNPKAAHLLLATFCKRDII
jgi:hypothetical protein